MENQGLWGVELKAAPGLQVFEHRQAHRSLASLASPKAWKSLAHFYFIFIPLDAVAALVFLQLFLSIFLHAYARAMSVFWCVDISEILV